jgi:hypothetical protein
MRVTGEIEYETEHGNHGINVVATWSVPYAALVYRGEIEAIEAVDNVLLTRLTLKAGGSFRDLALPVGPMLVEFQKSYETSVRGCDAELAELFTADCRRSHEYRTEQRQTHQRERANY